MARPRIFISSTYYDLKSIRVDLERFIKELGYDSIKSERGQIPYGKKEKLEQYCYREINNCDILVHVIGSKYGSPSSESPYSISQTELKTAHDLNKQVYIFVERNVHTEYKTYLLNEDDEKFRPQYVDDVKIYKFMKEVYNYASNNTVAEFDTVTDIMDYLREQWAGLFQRFLQDESRLEDYKITANLKSTADTLAEIIRHTTKERDDTIKTIMLNSHPIFIQLAEAAHIPIRIIFFTRKEMEKILFTFGFAINDCLAFEDAEYYRKSSSTKTTVTVKDDVFDENGNLKPVDGTEWDSQFVIGKDEACIDDDDLPF